MAAFASVERSATPTSTHSTAGHRVPATRRQLPDGACNFRDLTSGPTALSCGCRQFWSKVTSQESRDETRCGGARRDGDAWCCCGHHACYHESTQHCARTRSRQGNEVEDKATTRYGQNIGQSVYIQMVKATADGRFQLVTDAQPSVRNDIEGVAAYRKSPPPCTADYNTERSVKAVEPGSLVPSTRCESPTTVRVERLRATGRRPLQHDLVAKGAPSHAQAMNSHCVPSKRHPSSNGQRSTTMDGQMLNSASPKVFRTGSEKPYLAPNGLGLDVLSSRDDHGTYFGGPHSARICGSPHVVENPTADQLVQAARTASDNASTSVMGARTSPSRAFLHHVSQKRQPAPPIDVSCMQYPGYLGEDLMQSATEVATPSNAGTPDLRVFEQSVHGAKLSIDELLQDATSNCKIPGTNEKTSFLTPSGNHLRVENLPPETIAGPSIAPPLAGGLPSQVSPATRLNLTSLEQIIPYLTSVKQHIASLPNLSDSLQMFSNRLDALENASMSFGPVEDLQEKLEFHDGRLIDVENRLADHEKFHAALDPDFGSADNTARYGRPGKSSVQGVSGVMNANVSFGSNCSAHSTSSSAFLAAALGRAETHARFEDVEQRLADLEKLAPPSVAHPWAIEVILLPWGCDLKGIWFPPDDTGNEDSAPTPPYSEAWTQARSSKNSGSIFRRSGEAAGQGWNSETIQDWADASTQWLSARACGTRGVLYERLRSRGLVRNVSLTGSSARSVYSAVVTTFDNVLQAINDSHATLADCHPTDRAPGHSTYLGLNAAFVPLRKIHKSSRLRFLDPSELATPALWTAEFLGCGVIMKAVGGQKRLFITTPAAYLQHDSADSNGWTWQRLRQLPRVYLDREIGNGSCSPHVGEADAKESCWSYDPRLDPLMSINTSFCSNASRPSYHDSGHQPSPPPASGLYSHEVAGTRRVSQNPRPPITPVSELPPDIRPQHHRTISLPVDRPAALEMNLEPKRGVTSFEQLHPGSAAAEFSAEAKRRRYSHTPEPDIRPGGMWTSLTPRRSREPPSPFQSSRPRSQFTVEAVRDIAEMRKRRGPTPSAYATPHSGTIVKMEMEHHGSGGLGTDKSLAGFTASDDKGEEDGDVWEGVIDEDVRDEGGEQNLSGTEKDEMGDDDYDDDYDSDMEDVG